MSKLRQLLDIKDLCKILNCKPSWIHQRTGPKAKGRPHIPSVPGMKPLKFDPLRIEQIFFSGAGHASSLTIEGKKDPAVHKSEMRVIERLW